VELEQSRALLEKNGVRIAAISYDSQEILAAFARKHAIGYPLLSDKGSEVIRRFGILNGNMAPELRSYGVPHPVEYLISPDGVVVKKYFVPNYQHRVTASAVALEVFGEAANDAPTVTIESGALRAQIGFASRRAFAGQKVSFVARFTLEPGWHIYKATSIEFEGPAVEHQEVVWANPEIMELPLLDEIQAVYSGSFEAHGGLLLRFPLPDGELLMRGSLCFQQCSENVCGPPQRITFEIPLTLEPFVISDRDREMKQRSIERHPGSDSMNGN
jgi:hypothetical protein